MRPTAMSGATIGAAGGDFIPHLAKLGDRGSTYIVDILYAYNKEYVLHVYSVSYCFSLAEIVTQASVT